MHYKLLTIAIAMLLPCLGNFAAAEEPFNLVVMDPLAAPLSCPCVEGYAQRKYEELGKHLEAKLGRPVTVLFAQALGKVDPADLPGGDIHLIIGKDSVVRADAGPLALKLTRIAQLTDKTGMTTQHGMIVVPTDDPAKSPADLKGYTIHFGPSDSDEKHAAAIELLKANGVEPGSDLTISPACSDGASKIVENGPKAKGAAVISSYAQPLLEGCGTIQKGDLRVLAKTKEVPFITAFATGSLDQEERVKVGKALAEVAQSPELLVALETLIGFLPTPTEEAASPEANKTSTWNGWRGENRDGIVPNLPPALPEEANVVWETLLPGAGLGGIAANEQYVLLGDRDGLDFHDVFRCYDAATGEELWKVESLAIGKIDYGNSPRATPQIIGDLVLLHGAFGELHCVNLADGSPVWKRNLRSEFGVTAEMPWGYCGSPLVVDNKVIAQAGGAEASLVAFDLKTGELVWKTPGNAPSHGSLILANIHGQQQIIGHDHDTLGGWDPETGKRLWTLTPPHEGDFNVPTPILFDEKLLVVTENNGARLYRFESSGQIDPNPVMENRKLKPDMSTPVVVGNRLFCVHRYLYCLDLTSGLSEIYRQRDPALDDYAAIIADDHRLLVIGKGELLLADATTNQFQLISRLPIFEDPITLYSHPALVGNRLYLRSENRLKCVELE